MHQAFRVKREQFCTSKISKETSRPRQLWSSIDHLMRNSRSLMISCFIVDDFMCFFQRKDKRVSTEDMPSSTFAPSPGYQLIDFANILVDDIIEVHSLCSFKAIVPRSSPNVAPQGMRRDHLSVHRLVVQCIHEEWSGTKSNKGSIYNATAQEAYT